MNGPDYQIRLKIDKNIRTAQRLRRSPTIEQHSNLKLLDIEQQCISISTPHTCSQYACGKTRNYKSSDKSKLG